MKRKMQHLVVYITLFTLLVAAFFGAGGKIQQAQALNNGLALTPPMGWNTWNNYGCNITDALIRSSADAMVNSGMAAAGYKYINLDDCWQGTGRTNGHVNLDSDFPNMKALGDYIHSKGLKLGVYSDHGTATCAGRVGSYSYETTDANDYASWGVDYLKYDNCNLPAGDNVQADYTNMKNALASSGRAIVYSICAWNYQSWMPGIGNLWRTTGDISDSWASMSSLPNTNNASASVAGPGAWNDPDMLEVGRGGMTDTEYRTHFGWWAIMAAPLIAGNNITSMSQATKDILLAPEIIAVDQDSLGKQGTRVWDGGNWQNIWSKQMSGTNRRAVFVLNGSSSTTSITVSWSQIGLPAGNATVRDLWSKTDLGTFTSYTASNIPAHGSRMLMITSGSSGPTITPGGPTNTPTATALPSNSYEAEAGVRSGAAVTASCAACSGGSAVGYIGNGAANYLTLTVNASSAGNQSLTIYGIVSGTRSFSVSVNGGADQVVSMTGSDFTNPFAASPITVSLNAGSNSIKFHNDTAYAPDLDRIVITGGSGPTATPTRTPTPLGPTLTPTRTLTPGGPTATRTNTPTNTPVGPTNTPVVPTNTPTGGTGTCSPVTATITAPFTQDGAGAFCWQSSNLGAYINSWNTTSVTINGVNVTNLYMASGSYPAKINGYWYVSYNSTVSWGHFEAK